MSGNILFLGNKIFEIPPFFQTRPGDLGKKVHACSLRFSALNSDSRDADDASLFKGMRKYKYVIWGKGAVAGKRKRKKRALPLPSFLPFCFRVRAFSQFGVRDYLWRARATRPSRSRNRLLISERLSKIPKFSKSKPCSLEPLVNDHPL